MSNEERKDFLLKLADLFDEFYPIELYYTTDDDGVNISVGGKVVAYGFNINSSDLRAFAGGLK